jgi:hypothetical protein
VVPVGSGVAVDSGVDAAAVRSAPASGSLSASPPHAVNMSPAASSGANRIVRIVMFGPFVASYATTIGPAITNPSPSGGFGALDTMERS